MGRASRWLSKLLGRNRKKGPTSISSEATKKVHQCSAEEENGNAGTGALDPSQHAIAVAAATAAVAEAAIAAAKAATEVVRLTSGEGGRGKGGGSARRVVSLEEVAAVKIQSAFRGYLSRRALKALKGLVKIQALVRGYLVRKRSADMLRRMQAMARLQARARTNRVQSKNFSHFGFEHSKKYHIHQRNTSINDPFIIKRISAASKMREAGIPQQALSGANWPDNSIETSKSSHGSLKSRFHDDENTDKILEVDSWKPNLKPRRGKTRTHISSSEYHDHSFSASDSKANYLASNLQQPTASPFSDQEVSISSLRSLNFPLEASTAESSPQTNVIYSRPGSSSRRSRRNESSTSFLSSYMEGHPNYMANTESSQARVRSHSAPRQRPDKEKPRLTKRLDLVLHDPMTYLRNSCDQYGCSTRKFYTGSGRVDRLVIPTEGGVTGYKYF